MQGLHLAFILMPETKYPKPTLDSIAPNFTVLNQKGESKNLYQILDSGQKVLLIFYPGDMTPGCTIQLCGVRDVYSQYTAKGVTVFGVNHANAQSHQKFIDQQNYPFDILIDEDRKVSEMYGQLKFMFGIKSINRGVYLINTDKKIQYTIQGQQDNQTILGLL